MDLNVDELAEFIFTLEFQNTNSNTKSIRRYNLDGSGGTTIVDYPSGASKSANSFGIARSSQRVYTMEQNTSINGFTVNSYDYNGTFVQTLYIQTNGFGLGMGIGISPSEDYLFFHENIASASPSRSLIRYNLLDDTNTAVGTPTSSAESSGGTEPNEIVIDSLYPSGGVFAAFGEDVISFSYPDAPSDSVITSNPGFNHLAVDRFNQKLYYVGIGSSPGTERIREIGYDSSGDQEVHDEGADITSLDIGYN